MSLLKNAPFLSKRFVCLMVLVFAFDVQSVISMRVTKTLAGASDPVATLHSGESEPILVADNRYVLTTLHSYAQEPAEHAQIDPEHEFLQTKVFTDVTFVGSLSNDFNRRAKVLWALAQALLQSSPENRVLIEDHTHVMTAIMQLIAQDYPSGVTHDRLKFLTCRISSEALASIPDWMKRAVFNQATESFGWCVDGKTYREGEADPNANGCHIKGIHAISKDDKDVVTALDLLTKKIKIFLGSTDYETMQKELDGMESDQLRSPTL